MSKPGRLEIVTTPIGNLSDLTERARASLAEADLIAAEDTRHTQALLSAIGIPRPLISLHRHNEHARSAELIERLRAGARVALVSDAGTPLLSDPGGELVRAAIDAGIDVRPVPGVSAITAALSAAGVSADRFCFEGFLSARGGERRKRLAALSSETRTLVFFEAPHRIIETLEDLVQSFGEPRRAALARELTKTFETFYRGTLSELLQQAKTDPDMQRGEITLVIAGAAPVEQTNADPELLRKVVSALMSELPPAKVAALAAQITGVKRSEAYAAALRHSR